jgi:hypothetical protein
MRWGVWVGAAIGVLIIGIIVVSRFVLPALDDEELPANNRTWLEFAWANSPVSQDAVRQLDQRLKANGIDRVYLETSAWRSDGVLAEGEFVTQFVETLRAADRGLEILLWLRLTGSQITSPEVQSAVTELANKAVSQWQLDGVQLNGLTVRNGSETNIQLLRALRDTIGPDALLSVTVPPDRIPTDPNVPLGPSSDPDLTWDVNYKQRVGLLLIDEVVIMPHASGLQDSKAYETWTAYQITSYISALSELEEPVEVIVALPTYDAAPEHDPEIENLQAAIQGTKQGIEQLGKNGAWVKGVGLYEYKTTDSREWSLYRKYWLGLEDS